MSFVVNSPLGFGPRATASSPGAGTRGYNVYTALLTQSGTDAPVATVLENTLGGTVVWARGNVGVYTATLVGAFTANKTFGQQAAPTFELFWRTERTSDDVVTLTTTTVDDAFELSNGAALQPLPIEIRVYP